ncbi:MAG: hypothetical protein ACFCBW_11320 [Candidatus Competibacterales bacterium]
MKIQHTQLFTLLATGAIVSMSAQAGGDNKNASVTVMNCVGAHIDIKSYNKRDKSMAIPFNKKNNIAHGSSTTVKCGSSGECKIEFEEPSCGGNMNKEVVKHVSDGNTAVVYATGEWMKDSVKVSSPNVTLSGHWPLIEANTNTTASCAGYTTISCP